MEPFKSRIAPGQMFSMEFRERQGFVGIEASEHPAVPDPSEVVRRLVTENPGTNGTRIKALAKEHRIGKNTVDSILRGGKYDIQPGKGAEKLYSFRTETPSSRFPDP
jgi:hypothetical protein